MTGGQVNDVNLLDQLVLEAGPFYLLDRGYIDYRRLYLITQMLAFAESAWVARCSGQHQRL